MTVFVCSVVDPWLEDGIRARQVLIEEILSPCSVFVPSVDVGATGESLTERTATQEPPRCPYCKAFLTFFRGYDRHSRIHNAPTDSCVLGCANFECPVELYFVGDEADCIAQASNLKLVDRKVKEVLEAFVVELWSHRCKNDNCECKREIMKDIRARYPEPEKGNIR